LESLVRMNNLSDFYHEKSVLITGHTGFKGSYLALWLTRLGARVTGYALAPTTYPSNFESSCVRDVLTVDNQADIRDKDRLAAVIRTAAPDVVFHLAAQPLVRESYRLPFETFDVNIMGTICLLECIRALRHPCVIVIVTSDKCYENQERMEGYRETDPMGGHDPYSASKGAAEIVVASYRRSFFNPVRLSDHGVKLASARSGNVIGGGDWAPDRIGTDIVNALSCEQPILVRNPKAIRPWQHVLEPLSGYLALAAQMMVSNEPNWCSAWNFGPSPSDQLTVGELVTMYCNAWGQGTWKDMSCSSSSHEAGILRLNIEKSEQELGWRPRWTAANAVARTTAWYKVFYQKPGSSMREYCLADIAAYESAGTRPVTNII
jgi:CDP-glucose 4,6-dehydratase